MNRLVKIIFCISLFFLTYCGERDINIKNNPNYILIYKYQYDKNDTVNFLRKFMKIDSIYDKQIIKNAIVEVERAYKDPFVYIPAGATYIVEFDSNQQFYFDISKKNCMFAHNNYYLFDTLSILLNI